MSEPTCKANWFRACKFRPRFDTGEPTVTSITGTSAGSVAIIEASKPATYVKDVCERCGKVIER